MSELDLPYWEELKRLRAETDRLRAALKTIQEATVGKAVGGHIDYKPLSEFIDSALEQKAGTE